MLAKHSLPGIWQLGLHEELLGALCWVEVALPGHALHLLELSSLSSRLNVPAASKPAMDSSQQLVTAQHNCRQERNQAKCSCLCKHNQLASPNEPAHR